MEVVVEVALALVVGGGSGGGGCGVIKCESDIFGGCQQPEVTRTFS